MHFFKVQTELYHLYSEKRLPYFLPQTFKPRDPKGFHNF